MYINDGADDLWAGAPDRFPFMLFLTTDFKVPNFTDCNNVDPTSSTYCRTFGNPSPSSGQLVELSYREALQVAAHLLKKEAACSKTEHQVGRVEMAWNQAATCVRVVSRCGCLPSRSNSTSWADKKGLQCSQITSLVFMFQELHLIHIQYLSYCRF